MLKYYYNLVIRSSINTIGHVLSACNQQVLSLANTEGGRAQSLFVWPKTA